MIVVYCSVDIDWVAALLVVAFLGVSPSQVPRSHVRRSEDCAVVGPNPQSNTCVAGQQAVWIARFME